MNAELTTLVADVMGIDEKDVTDSLSREEEERWDSLTHLRLVTAVEEAFSIRFSMDEIENIATLKDVDELVASKSGAA
jgi:acyl carrier protein